MAHTPARRAAVLGAAIALLALSLSPGLAEARAGRGGSFGSRGARTWSAPPSTSTAPSYVSPMERSLTPRTAPAPAPGFAPGMQGAPARSGFTSGLLGGLLGAGIGGLLLGHGFFGSGAHGGLGFLGFILQLLILYFIVRWLWRRVFGRGMQPAVAGMARMGHPAAMGGVAGPAGAGPGRGGPGAGAVAIGPQDYQAFERTLQAVQAAWTARDLGALQQLATPEMVAYFNEQLSELASRGLRNSVTDVRLEQGDLAEAWTEGGREYATVAMRFSMLDVTQDAAGRVVEGDATTRSVATELWTFVRTPGGRWLLSAIQQAR